MLRMRDMLNVRHQTELPARDGHRKLEQVSPECHVSILETALLISVWPPLATPLPDPLPGPRNPLALSGPGEAAHRVHRVQHGSTVLHARGVG